MYRRYDIFDLVKFVLSFFVVGIHTLGQYGQIPILRIAVPLFFIISGYLFFSSHESQVSKKKIKKFIHRNGQLYIFWFVASLPITIIKWAEEGLFKDLRGALTIFVRFLFGSTWGGSWFVAALIVDVCLIWWIDTRSKGKWWFVFWGGIYIVCCVLSNYYKLLSEHSILIILAKLYPGVLYNSFPAGLVWVWTGKIFAQNRTAVSFVKKQYWIGALVVSAVLFWGECYFVKKLESGVANDCFFMLLPLCISLFGILVNIDINCKLACQLRKVSVIIYCSHTSVYWLVKHVIDLERKMFGNSWGYEMVQFGLTIMLCGLLSYLILMLEKKCCCKILRASY